MKARDAMEDVRNPWPSDTMAYTIACMTRHWPTPDAQRAIKAATQGASWQRHIEYFKLGGSLDHLLGPADDA